MAGRIVHPGPPAKIRLDHPPDRESPPRIIVTKRHRPGLSGPPREAELPKVLAAQAARFICQNQIA